MSTLSYDSASSRKMMTSTTQWGNFTLDTNLWPENNIPWPVQGNDDILEYLHIYLTLYSGIANLKKMMLCAISDCPTSMLFARATSYIQHVCNYLLNNNNRVYISSSACLVQLRLCISIMCHRGSFLDFDHPTITTLGSGSSKGPNLEASMH